MITNRKGVLIALTGLCVIGSVSSAYIFGNPFRPYDVVGVKFCPQTANKKNKVVAQEKLDRTYCDYERKILKEVWSDAQFEASKPLPEPNTPNSAFVTRLISKSSDTATGGSDGTSKGRDRGTIRIDRKTANGKTPLKNVTINGLNDSNGEPIENLKGTIPDWLNPDLINNHFSNFPIEF